MLSKFSSIRYMYIRSHLYALFLVAILLLATLLTIQVVFEPDWLTEIAVFTFVILYVLYGFIVSIYVGFKSSGNLIDRIVFFYLLIFHYVIVNYQLLIS